MTEPVDWIGSKNEGYIVNAGFNSANTEVILQLMQYLSGFFSDALSFQKEESLHITLFDWVAPLVDYDGQDKKKLLEGVQAEYDSVLTEILTSVKPIKVRFNEIRVYPTTIIIVGSDNGEFKSIRDEFVRKVHLISGTKQPPEIIHSSIARFTKAIEIDPLKEISSQITIDFEQTISEFRLVHTQKEPVLEFEVIKEYKLT